MASSLSGAGCEVEKKGRTRNVLAGERQRGGYPVLGVGGAVDDAVHVEEEGVELHAVGVGSQFLVDVVITTGLHAVGDDVGIALHEPTKERRHAHACGVVELVEEEGC
jgi:hypothetical protein